MSTPAIGGPPTGDGAPFIYITAGEPSGDQLGANLMRALKEATGGKVRFAGIGGDRMQAEGLASLFPMSDLALMGFEILPRLPGLLRRIRETAADVRAKKPDALVTIDAQGFSKRIGMKLSPISSRSSHSRRAFSTVTPSPIRSSAISPPNAAPPRPMARACAHSSALAPMPR
jgi:hypothetical protein